MKKFIISSDKLKETLDVLSHAVGNKNTLPALENILFRVTNKEVEMITCNLDLTISAKVAAETQGGEFELMLPFNFINKVMSLTSLMPVSITMTSESKAKLKCDTDEYDFNSLISTENFPKTPAVSRKKPLSLNEKFIELLTHAMKTVSKDEARPAMMRACFDIAPDKLQIVSTDTHMLYSHEIDGIYDGTEKLQFNQKLADALKGMKEVELSWSEKMMCIRSANYIFWAKRYDNQYPNWRVVIPKLNPNVKIGRDNLVLALKKASLSSHPTKQTNFSLSGENVIRLTTADPDREQNIQLDIPAEYADGVPGFSIDPRKLLRLMDQISVDSVHLHVTNPTKAILLTSDDDAQYLGLLMPIANQ